MIFERTKFLGTALLSVSATIVLAQFWYVQHCSAAAAACSGWTCAGREYAGSVATLQRCSAAVYAPSCPLQQERSPDRVLMINPRTMWIVSVSCRIAFDRCQVSAAYLFNWADSYLLNRVSLYLRTTSYQVISCSCKVQSSGKGYASTSFSSHPFACF